MVVKRGIGWGFQLCLWMGMACFASWSVGCGAFDGEKKRLGHKTVLHDASSSDPSDPNMPPDVTHCFLPLPDEHSWGSMGPSEKKTIMQTKILPIMQGMFQKFDKARYSGKGQLHCQTCHGESKTDGPFDFSKPSSLYPLDPKNMPRMDDPDPKKAAMVRFMYMSVLPEMKRLLDRPDLTCFGCHAKGKPKPPSIDNGEELPSLKNPQAPTVPTPKIP